MSKLQEIEKVVQGLSDDELAAFREWFAEFDGSRWDEQFERDVAAGKLDGLADEALGDLREGRCKDL